MAIDLLNTEADESWLHDLFDENTNDDWAGFGGPMLQEKYAHLFTKYNHEHDALGRFTTSAGVKADDAIKAALKLPVTPASEGFAPIRQMQPRAYFNAAVSRVLAHPEFNSQIVLPKDGEPKDLQGFVPGASEVIVGGGGIDELLMRTNIEAFSGVSGLAADFLLDWDSAGPNGQYTVFMSKAASDLTGIELSHRQQDLNTVAGYNENFSGRPMTHPTWDEQSGERIAQGAALFRASYDQTQAYYKNHPELTDDGQGKTVTLYRGVAYDSTPPELEGVGTGGSTADIVAKPLTSWTSDLDMAGEFARDQWHTHGGHGSGASYVLSAKVPVERIVGNGIVGFGRPSQSEHVVLGGPMKVHAGFPQ